MKLPQQELTKMSNELLMNTKKSIDDEIKRRIDFLNGKEEEGMEGLGALFG